MVTLLLLLLLLIIAISINFVKNNYYMILYTAMFSFCAASLYFVNSAPDLALAEMAIGCAFVPLIYTIAIRRQNTFTVVFFSQEGSGAYCPPELLIEFMGIMEIYCAEKGMKLRLVTHPEAYEATASGIFKMGNTDLIANYFEEEEKLHLWGDLSNKLIPPLSSALNQSENMTFEPLRGALADE